MSPFPHQGYCDGISAGSHQVTLCRSPLHHTHTHIQLRFPNRLNVLKRCPSECAYRASLHHRLQTLRSVCRTVGNWGIPGGTHTWEVIEREEMAHGSRRGAQTAGMRIPFMWTRRHKYCTPRIFCCSLPRCWATDESMLINVFHMYICSLRCKDHSWYLETPFPFKRTLIHHFILLPQ